MSSLEWKLEEVSLTLVDRIRVESLLVGSNDGLLFEMGMEYE